ncbi:MAG: hypothetical protein IPK88_18190 [Saprospiraceae bacterium]|nr:hypothetical protein [Candidatus Defluviibacterium haderslevense]
MKHYTLKVIAYILAIIGFTILSSIWCYFYISQILYNSQWLITIYTDHFLACIGIPLAAIGAGIVVILFESKSGPIKFEIFNFKFEGSSGEVIMWILIFISESLMLKLVW